MTLVPQTVIAACAALRLRLRRGLADERGVSAVEFAMLLPLLITLYLGAVEISQAVSIDRKASLVARAVADLVSQGTNITDAEMTNILNAGKSVVAPYSDTNLKIVVSSIKIDANKAATIVWSDATSNATKRPNNQSVTVPSGLLAANTYLIWAEVTYTYTPAIGYIITGSMNLTEQMYMRPRVQDQITRSAT